MNVADELAVVTGATSGIGKATAKRLAAEGAEVALLARTESDLEAVAGTIRDRGGTATVYPTDLAERAQVEATAGRIQDELGPPGILVNSAGIGSWVTAWEAEPGQFEHIMAVTVFGAYNLCRAFLPTMLERNRGHVVTVESLAGYGPVPGATVYGVARWALRGLNESLWVDLHGTNVGVTSVIPGLVDTEYFERNEKVEERMPAPARDFEKLDPVTVAEAVLDGIREGKRRVYRPRKLQLMVGARRLFPNRFDSYNAKRSWQPSAGD